jgi:hypothetical protein
MSTLIIRALERIVDCDGLIRFVQRLGEATKKEKGRAAGSMGESALKWLFGLRRDAVGKIERSLQLTTS